MSVGSAYVVAARRTALGRLGGLHRSRRLEELAGPLIVSALKDCDIRPDAVDAIMLGNASAGGNPARIVGLAAGLPDRAAALTFDSQCASGLEAILHAAHRVALGDAEVVVAGGAEALSTAPWRIAKPKGMHQLPRFLGLEPSSESDDTEESRPFEASEALAKRLAISRHDQDAYAVRTHLAASAARDAKRFVGEIVALRMEADEARDQSAGEPGIEDLSRLPPFSPPNGTLTAGNTSALHDGAAVTVVVSERVWGEIGKPAALRFVAGSTLGVAPDAEAEAPLRAAERVLTRAAGIDRGRIGQVETSEASAAQAIALARGLGIDVGLLNPDGGAVARGHPLAAAGALIVVRLFTRMARQRKDGSAKLGLATQGAVGGIGAAALFEAV